VLCFYVTNVEILDKWEAPPISQVSKELLKVHGLIRQHEAANEQSFSHVHDELEKFRFVVLCSMAVIIIIIHELYRLTVMEALNEQKQMIDKLIPKQENESEA